MTYEISQVIVVFAEACLVSSFYLKEKYKQLIFLLLSSVLLGTQFFLLNAYTGMFLEVLCLIRILCLFFTEKKSKNSDNIFLALTFSIISLVVAKFTYVGWLTIMPTLGFISFTMLNAFKNQYLSRISYIVYAIFYGIYNFMIGSFTAFAFNIIICVSAFVLLIMLIKKNKDNKLISENNKIEDTNVEEIKND